MWSVGLWVIKNGTTTKTDGSFSIDVNVLNVLEFIIVGYQKEMWLLGKPATPM